MKNDVELKKGTVIYVDADACPVKEEISAAAKKSGLQVIFVISINNRMNHPSEGSWVYVENEKEAADLYILNHASKGDVVVTGDIGLAGLFCPKKFMFYHPGERNTRKTISAHCLTCGILRVRFEGRENIQRAQNPFQKKTEWNL